MYTGVPRLIAASVGLAATAVSLDYTRTPRPENAPTSKSRDTQTDAFSKKESHASEAVATLVRRKMLESGAPGVVVGVSVDGRRVYERGFGRADVENDLAAHPATVMRIASISKAMTLAVLGRLMDQGKVDLDRPVAEYVTQWPKGGEKENITLRQLSSHMSGVRHYTKKGEKANDKEKKGDARFKEFYMNEKFDSVMDALSIFKDDELLSSPGSEYHYTTHGFTLLSAAIEAISGEPFELSARKMFRDLGLERTYLDESEPIIPNRARYYMRKEKHRLVNAPHVDNSCKWAGGGFLSNVPDLLRFGNAMLYSFQQRRGTDKPGFLTSDTVSKLWQPVVPMSKNPQSLMDDAYAMGWMIKPSKGDDGDDHPAFARDQAMCAYHTGGAIGASSVLFIKPNKDSKGRPPRGVVVAILCNLDGVQWTGLASDIAKEFEETAGSSSS